jgi:hypothetical protein
VVRAATARDPACEGPRRGRDGLQGAARRHRFDDVLQHVFPAARQVHRRINQSHHRICLREISPQFPRVHMEAFRQKSEMVPMFQYVGENLARVVVARLTFDDDQAKPAITLPAFALVARLRDPELMQRELKRIFQSLVGFFNIVGAMNGQPQLDLGSDSEGGHPFFTATVVRDVDRHQNGNLPVAFNFSPTLAFVGDTVIVSSTTPPIFLSSGYGARPRARNALAS